MGLCDGGLTYLLAVNAMDIDRPPPPNAAESRHTPSDCSREVFALAEALRRNGGQRRLRDVTIVLPTDHSAVEAIELACLALSEGEFSEAAGDLNRFLERITQNSSDTDRFLISLRAVAQRVGQAGE